jgi:ATP-dependent exoDNAse (exonuclease V) beta subunit
MSSELDKARQNLDAANRRWNAASQIVYGGGSYTPTEAAEWHHAAAERTRRLNEFKDAEFDERIRAGNERYAAKAAEDAVAEAARVANLPRQEFVPGKVGQRPLGPSAAEALQARREAFEKKQAADQASFEAKVATSQGRPKAW